MKATAEAIIKRDVEDVWDFIADPKNMEQWVVGVANVVVPEGEFGAGSTFSSSYTYNGRTSQMSYVVTAFEKPDHMTMVGSGPFPFEGHIELAPIDGGTRIRNTIDAKADGCITSVMFFLLPWMLKPMMRKQLQKELDALAAILEEKS